MKKFLLTLATVAIATSSLMAQTNTQGVVEEPDRVQMRELSKDPTGKDILTSNERPQVVAPKHECKDHKDGQPCTKPADQQCDDCKAKAAAQKHECKKGEGQKCDKAGAMKQECKDGAKQCDKAGAMKHECKDGAKQCPKEGMKHECKDGAKQCDKAGAMKHECKKGEGQKCDKAGAMKHECKEGAKKCDKPEGMKKCDKAEGMKHECKEGMKKCDKPADQQCPDCKEKAAPKKK